VVFVVWGWACAVVGSLLSVPQILRLLLGRTSAGVSLLLWQLLLGGGLGWTYHGIVVGHANLIVPNALSAALAALVLAMLARDRHLPARRVWPLGLAVGLALVAVEVLGGSAAFGIAVIAPFIVGLGGQTRDLLRSPDLSGLSPLYVVGTLVVQLMWWSWALGVGELSTLICSTVVGLVALTNVLLWAARTRGVLLVAPAPVLAEAA